MTPCIELGNVGLDLEHLGIVVQWIKVSDSDSERPNPTVQT